MATGEIGAAQERPEAAAEPVPDHGVADPAPDRERDGGVISVVGRDPGHRERSAPPTTTLRELHEGRMGMNSANQAERRLRPLSRRDFRTARPARVCIRDRNPCFFDRLRLFGWNVRFNAASSTGAGAPNDPRPGVRGARVNGGFYGPVHPPRNAGNRPVPAVDNAGALVPSERETAGRGPLLLRRACC